MPSPGKTTLPDPVPPGGVSRAWPVAAAGLLAVAAAAAACTRLWNYDIFWHLACGDWMLRQGRLLDFDPFSIDGQARWVNVHWLFQVVASCLHSLGGVEALAAMKSALAASGMLLFALGLRRRVPSAWLIPCGLAALVVMQERLRARPESFTLPLTILTVLLADSVRRGAAPRRLWLLAPAMVLWVNMHGLYVLGPALLGSLILGGAMDRLLGRGDLAGELTTRRALLPAAVAAAACLINPWPFEAVAQPLLLWTRISGRLTQYTTGVWEFQPTWEVPEKYLTAIALAALTLAALILNRRRVPAGHMLWFVALAFLAVKARRNVALTGPVFGYLLAVHGADVIRRVASTHPALNRLSRPIRWAAAMAALAIAAGYATEWMHRLEGSARRFGTGLQREIYPREIARFLRDLPGEGDIYCENFGDSATFIYHTWPRRRTFMDGRLEAHPPERFAEQVRIRDELASPASAGRVRLPDSVRFIVVRWDHRSHLVALAQCPRFRLAFADPAAACFERTDLPGQPPATETGLSALSLLDRPLSRDGEVADMPVEPFRWYRANSQPTSYRVGEMLLFLGQTAPGARASPLQQACSLLAVRYLTAATCEPRIPRRVLDGMAAQAWQQWAAQHAHTPEEGAPVDLALARAMYLYGQMDLTDLADPETREFVLQRIGALLLDGQLDAAADAVAAFLRQASPEAVPASLLLLRDDIVARLTVAQAQIAAFPSALPQRAELLAGRDVGLIDRAIEECLADKDDPAAVLVLGDLLLRKGRTDQARRAYRFPEPTGDAKDELELRLTLCDWVEGRLHQAAGGMSDIAERTGNPLAQRYFLTMREILGDDKARHPGSN